MLQHPSSTPLSNKSSLAFGIKFNGQQGHVALIYRNEALETWLLHFAGHQDLRHQLWDESYHWVEFNSLDIEVQDTFADWAVLVSGNCGMESIPYSTILSDDRNFALNGSFIDRKNSTGLTCASFLLAIFADYGLPLVEVKSWPKGRMSDKKWALTFLKIMLEQFPGLHFTAQLERVFRIVRFRPEEVVVIPALYAGKPLKIKDVEPSAKNCRATFN